MHTHPCKSTRVYKEEPLHDRKFGVHATSALCWQATMNMNEIEKDSQKEVKTTLQVDQVELRANTYFRTSHLVIRTFLFFNTAHTHPSPPSPRDQVGPPPPCLDMCPSCMHITWTGLDEIPVHAHLPEFRTLG